MTRKKTEKSEQTLAAIVACGFEIAKRLGLQAVSLTSVAKELGISKGGVALRVGSLESLKNLVLDQHEAHFRKVVFEPAMELEPGIDRLDGLVMSWIRFSLDMNTLLGSLYAHCAFEVDAENIALRSRLIQGFVLWQRAMERTVTQAVTLKHLRPDTDPEQLVLEVFGLMLGFMYQQRLSRTPHTVERAEAAYKRLMWPYRSVVA